MYRHHFGHAETASFWGLATESWTTVATFLAVIVALGTPWVMEWLARNRRSLLSFQEVSVIHQEESPDEYLPYKLLDVGRLVIENKGKYTARGVEAYIEKIVWNGEMRKDFIPMPLSWTHGQVNKLSTVRDIYPNQKVFLDVFNHLFNHEYVGQSSVVFAVATGLQYEDLSKLNLGESQIFIKLYQESGQVSEQILKVRWDGKSVPKMVMEDHSEERRSD